MKFYKKRYLAYTWPVYTMILVLSFFLFFGIFEIKDNYKAKEKLTIFISASEIKKEEKYETFRSVLHLWSMCLEISSPKEEAEE